ncbi:SusC/RagA family TonB-linked outer membrane protein [Mucilaginibacter calamicampi]|uniref:SusC/RagA family TonB-linked outer membrane protein n=1 Tax=Mucilaginibacter calamicampi TaxID=1302352 RepID=A0ABW2Z1U4_9SPHI
MKLTLFFILIFNIGAFANVFSQTTISLNLKDADLEKAIQTIESKSSFRFVYSTTKKLTDKKISLRADNENLTDVLNKVFGEFGLAYKEVDTHLVSLTKAGEATTFDDVQQGFRVTGQVTDETTGETLIGATVKIKGTTNAVAVDVNGRFTLDVPNANSVLVVAFIGYTEQEVAVDGKRVLDVKLTKVTRNLEEVVVSGFGLTNRKATLAGAITTLSGDDLSRSRATSASGALVGKVSGVNFRQTNGRPGATPTIRIRGFGGDPLYVIDGISRDADAFNNLDFNDIEQINVLKDGSAAIYGFAAENGVIVVTTKKGKRNQKPTIGFDSYYGIQQVANFNKPADIKTYIKGIVQSETYGNGITSNAVRSVTKADYDKWMAGTEPGYQGFDWYKYIYKDAPQSQYRVTLSGGSENADYYIAGSTTAQSPMLRDFGTGFVRHNIQANINANVSKRIKFGVGINGYWSKRENTNIPGDDYDFAAETSYRNLPTKGPFANDNPLYPQNSAAGDWTYSYGLVNGTRSGVESNTTRNLQVNANMEISIVDGLKARVQAAYAFTSNHLSSRRLSNTTYKYNATTNTYDVDQFNDSRNLDRSISLSDQTTLQGQFDYKKAFGKHNINAVLGFEKRLGYNPSLRVNGNPPANNIPYTPNVRDFITNIEDNISNYNPRLGYIGKVNYDYAGKYIVEVSGRYDGNSGYPTSRQYGFFPGGQVAYRISQEDFWKNSSILSKIDDFKIKGSYGVVGFNEGANTYFTGYTYNPTNNGQPQPPGVLNGSQILGTAVRGLPSTLTWGRVYQSNVGIEATLLNNRLSLDLAYFNKTRSGIAASRDVNQPDLAAITPGQENLNSDKNRGVDGSIQWRDRIGEVSYNIGGNFSYGRSITGFRFNQLFSSTYNRWRGSAVDRLNGGPFQLVSVGQFQSWEDIATYPIDQDGKGNQTFRPGDFKFKDTNGDGFITDEDRQRTGYGLNTANNGNPAPALLNFGFNFGATYKGFNFSVDFAGGTMMTFDQGGFMREWEQNKNTSQYLMDNSSWYSDIWDRNSPIIVGKYPLLLQQTAIVGSTLTHSGWQTNVTYVKMRNVEIGYTLPYTLLKPIGISNFKVYVSGQNVLQISNMPAGLDAEIASSGGNAMPSPRVLTAGVQVKF